MMLATLPTGTKIRNQNKSANWLNQTLSMLSNPKDNPG